MKKLDYTRRLRNFAINFGSQHPSSIGVLRLVLNLKTAIIKAVTLDFHRLHINKSFFRYFVCIVLLLISTMLWGFFASHNIAFLLLGLGLSYFSLSRVIMMAYPQSLSTYLITSESGITKFNRNKRALFLLVVTLFVSYVFCLNLFSLVEWAVELIIDNYQLLIVLQNTPQILTFVGLLGLVLIFPVGRVYLPKLELAYKKRFKLYYWTRTNKKVLLFFRLYPKAKKNVFIDFLAVLTLFIGTIPFFFSFCTMVFTHK